VGTRQRMGGLGRKADAKELSDAATGRRTGGVTRLPHSGETAGGGDDRAVGEVETWDSVVIREAEWNKAGGEAL